MKKKHAYMIIAHNEFEILEKLIVLLDDERNDIYLHIDKKVKDFPFHYFKGLVKKSNIEFVERKDVRWGAPSQIECELELLKASTKNNYSYYHLISGVDLPLKSQNEIHKFFEDNEGKEFIHFCSFKEAKHVENRVKNYHFMKYYKSSNKLLGYSVRNFNKIIGKLQKVVRFERKWDNSIKLCFGAQWFSITDELAKYVVSKEKWINNTFKFTTCSDELFLQTLVYNSKFYDNVYLKGINDYKTCMRYIDWKRGNPYVFRKENFKELIESDRLFARKFSSNIDNEIITKIFNYLNSKK
ncbi:beta-1,6-N-acetylglucosaminyltransferase [Clostridium perfringens]|nr:glycosyl transferase [Clostridium perfringens]MDK0873804.1 beta-1,6-N-acetylglucosaminyltransferase [Clostridium perfringens]MDM0976272.1 beta-1,6-N-acetylglucosaminyltransferase [Clostridium perfringens]